jgi:hypothetical protein
MRAVLALLLFAATLTVQAQPRVYQQSELDALLAPIALYPDALLSQVLIASTYPDEVREAAAWLRANPNLKGDEAVRAAEPAAWDPSVKTLLAYPDLLARMDESPHWLADLGAAFVAQEPQVMETVQALRRRAQATGFLQSDGYQSVLQDDGYVVVQPAQPYIAYVPWYNPVVVYGPWWHAHRPIAWRPWHPRPPVFVSLHVQKHKPAVDWRHRHVQRVHVRKPIRVHRPVHVHRPAQRPAQIHNHVHQAQTARPIIQGARIQESVRIHGRDFRKDSFHRPMGELRSIHRGEHRSGDRGRGQSRSGGGRGG